MITSEGQNRFATHAKRHAVTHLKPSGSAGGQGCMSLKRRPVRPVRLVRMPGSFSAECGSCATLDANTFSRVSAVRRLTESGRIFSLALTSLHASTVVDVESLQNIS